MHVVHLAEDIELHIAAGDGGSHADAGERHGRAEVLRLLGSGGLGALAGIVVLRLLHKHGVDPHDPDSAGEGRNAKRQRLINRLPQRHIMLENHAHH